MVLRYQLQTGKVFCCIMWSFVFLLLRKFGIMNIIFLRIQKEVNQWTRNKSLRIILNKFFDHPYRGEGYLTPDASFSVLRKSYRKAVSKVHPDRNINSSFEEKCRNEAVFLALQSTNHTHKSNKRKSFRKIIAST